LKKIICITVALLVMGLGTVMAAPLNDLATGQTAVGVSNDNLYIENKVGSRITVGLQSIDLNDDSSTDLYGQYNFTNNFRGIIGHRDYSSGSTYLGVGVTGALDNKWDGHAYVIFADEFTEVQAGATYNITSDLGANVYFRSFMPDAGNDKHRVGAGLTYKF